METYRELYFDGTVENLERFVSDIKEYVRSGWVNVEAKGILNDYLLFDYIGNKVDRAQLSIHIGNLDEKQRLKVTNIVPEFKTRLTISEYNSILSKFYEDVIVPYKRNYNYIQISELSSDKFDPLSVISKAALEKLTAFNLAANKSTGSQHPCDRERWFDFICQTVDDNKMFDYMTLSVFLKDEKYWGKKEENYFGVIGNFAWNDDWSKKLAEEYETLTEVLTYYKSVNSRCE